MKRIDEILDHAPLSEEMILNRLTAVLVPFALHATGKVPVYSGSIPNSMELIESNDGEYIFVINKVYMAIYRSGTVTVLDSQTIKLSDEDNRSVIRVIAALKDKERSEKKKVTEAQLEAILMNALSKAIRN